MASAGLDISSIRALVARARRRLRGQAALETATTSIALAAAVALAAVYLVRAYIVAPETGDLLLGAAGAIVVIGALIGAVRRLHDEDVARRIDRASNLSDRLSTAVAFERVLGGPEAGDPDTRDLMRAAVRDAIRAVPRASVQAATPYRLPQDGRAAAVFVALAVAAAGLGLPTRDSKVTAADPSRQCADLPVVIRGEWLCGPRGGATADCTHDGQVVRIVRDGADPIELVPDRWYGDHIELAIPAGVAPGAVRLEVVDGAHVIGSVPFEVVDCVEEKKHNPDAITWDPDDRAYVKDLLQELRETAKRDQSPELDEYVKRVEELLTKAEQGELTKEQLLDELKKAEEAMDQGAEPDQQEVDKDLADTGKELEKNELTKELAKALEKNDLEKAKQEMEKLADKMEKGELSEKQKEELAKALEKASKQYEQKEQQRQKQQQDKIDQAQKEVRELEKKKQDAKTEQEKQDADRRLEKKKRELEKLKKDQEDKEQSNERRALKRLHKDMKDAAEDLQKKPDKNKDKQQQQEDKEQSERQASEKMKKAAEETGKVDQDQRKTATKKKVASQMDDLREAMRRAKRQGKQGQNNPFGKNGKQSDFEKRARGQRGEKGAWKPGQEKGQGQNGGKADGKPDGPSDTWGVGHDENLTGDPTAKSGDDKDQDLSGTHGKGPSRRETILSAAQKGFASKGYQKVYADYKRIVEEVMRSEKVPSSYKYYIKKYFTKIKPHSMD